jgi:hypothetical protein
VTLIEIIGLLKRGDANKAFGTRNYTLANLNRDICEVRHTAHKRRVNELLSANP